MENNNPENIAAFEVFNNTEDLAASMNQEQAVAEPAVEQTTETVEQPAVEEAPQQQFEQPAQEVQETVENTPQPVAQEEYSDEELQSAVFDYLSEVTGEDIKSIDDLYAEEEDYAVDERVDAIARFVEETGRAPEDWFRFQ